MVNGGSLREWSAVARGERALRNSFVLTVWVAAAAACPAAAQSPRSPEVWRWIVFTADAGLPGTRVSAVAEASDGIIWAGTDKGLAWFDGYRWSAIPAALGMPRVRVLQVEPDRRGGVLVVADSILYRGDTSGVRAIPVAEGARLLRVGRAVPAGGDSVLVLSASRLYACAGSECRRVGPRQGLPSGDVGGLWGSRARGCWVSAERGLFAQEGTTWRLRLPRVSASWPVQALAVGPDGRGIVATRGQWMDGGLWEWDDDGPLLQNLGQPRLSTVAGDVGPNGAAAVAYASADLSVRERGVWRWLPVPAGIGAILAVRYASNGDLWVGGESGLYLYRATSRLWTYSRSGRADPGDVVNALLRTRDGSVWMGTEAGARVLRPDGRIERFREAGGVLLLWVTGLAVDDSGGVWVSSGNSPIGALRWDGRAWRRFGARDGLGASRIHRIVKDRRGRLWFLGLGGPPAGAQSDWTAEGPGAFVLERGRFIRWGVREGLRNGRVYGVAEGQDGTLWFATARGLSRYRGGAWRHWAKADGLVNDRVFAVAVDDQQRVWFTHQSGGLGSLNARGELRYLTTADGLPSDEVWEVQVAPDGALWVGTAGGLARCRDGACTPLRMDDGLTSLQIWPVLPTVDRVYVGTIGAGLDVLDLAEARAHDVRVQILSSPALMRSRAVVRWRADGFLGWPASTRILTRARVDSGAWSSWTTDRALTLGSPRSGSHLAEVEARDWLGNTSGRAAARFTIAPPLLLQPAVFVPLVALLVLAGWLGGTLVLRRREYEAERRTAEARNRRLAAAVEQTGDGIAFTDRGGVAEFVNPAFESITGWSASDVAGRPVRHLLVGPDDTGYFGAVVEVLERGDTWEGEGILHRKDRGVFRAHQRITPLRAPSGEVTHFVWMLRDVTRDAELRERLREAQKLQAVGQLTGGIAHDFNNLLAVILLSATMLVEEERGASAVVRRGLDAIIAAVGRGAAVVDSLLAFGRRRRLVIRPTDPIALVSELAVSLRSLFPETIAVEVCADADVPSVLADAAALQQALLSLATNARDAMTGGGTLTLTVSRADAGAAADTATSAVQALPHVCITVTDTGCGMDAPTLGRAYEPFFTTKPTGSGKGLGLSMVYGLVQQHGGEISIASAPGAGTTVRLSLPVAHADAAPAPAIVQPDAAVPGASGAILLVEDFAPVRGAAELALTRLGYRVLSAADGLEALELYRSRPGEIRLVVTDLLMPRLDGIGLYDALGPEGKRPPFIFTSGYALPDSARDRVLDPAVPFLRKPWTAEQLASAVREALGQR
jgi:PAS domain S-box-containing protein